MGRLFTTRNPESVRVKVIVPLYLLPFQIRRESAPAVTGPISAAVSSAIRTCCCAPPLKVPRTTGTLPTPPPPRGDDSETHAAIPRMAVVKSHARARLVPLARPKASRQRVLGNRRLH